MVHSKTHTKSFSQSLSLTFAGSALVLLLSGGFALYLMSQLGTAVERAIDDILPKTLVAMRLSEHSALLAASAPSLTNARNPRETEQIAADLDDLKKEIDNSLAILEENSQSNRLEQVRNNVAILADTLSRLKSATNQRIALDEKRSSAVAEIHEVHSEFSDTVSPVVWGVSSLTRLFGKRAARANVASLKALRDRHVERLVALMQLQQAYSELASPGMSSIRPSYPQIWDAFGKAWLRALKLLQNPANSEDLLDRQLIDSGEKFHAGWQRRLRGAGSRQDPQFEAALTRAITGAQDALAQHFATALKTAESTVAAFVDQSVKDMGYALDIKAEGNLSFALLSAVADADSYESVSSLQDRFKRSRAAFLISLNDFLGSRLSQRNPILAGNVAGIESRVLVLGEGPDNLFDVRRAQLNLHAQLRELLASNRHTTAQLKQDVEQLVEDVQGEASGLGVQLDRSRGLNRALLIMVFLVGLMLLLMIAFFSVRTLRKQDRDIRQAAMVFESTGEGVIITDPHARIIAVNQAFCELTGYQRDEIAGRSIRVLRSRHQGKAFYEEMFETLAQTGRWEGEIYTRKKSGNSHLEWLTVNVVKDNQDRISQFVAVFSDVAIVKRSLQKLDHLAHHDPLTGLPNRLLLRDRLEHAIHRARREQRQLAVLFLDLDRFKNINDTLGHTVGDHLLRIFAGRLSSRIREGDTVARLGGDEFMVLLEGYQAPKMRARWHRASLTHSVNPSESRVMSCSSPRVSGSACIRVTGLPQTNSCVIPMPPCIGRRKAEKTTTSFTPATSPPSHARISVWSPACERLWSMMSSSCTTSRNGTSGAAGSPVSRHC
jgi:diguanylate cyclase (GGDEF)-like protein/PAS domain S-box-containing protein